MAFVWSRDFLTRRIDRCYLIAAGARKPEKRKIHLELARYYRRMLSSLTSPHQGESSEWALPSRLPETSKGF